MILANRRGSFLHSKSLVIELDKELYGPDNHLVEWHRMPTTQETDGFQVKRPGDLNVKCTLLLMLDHQPPQYKLDPRLARLLGVHTQTRAAIMQALWLLYQTQPTAGWARARVHQLQPLLPPDLQLWPTSFL